MTLEQATTEFKRADHELQLAWGCGDPNGIAAAKKRRNKAYNNVARLIKARLTA